MISSQRPCRKCDGKGFIYERNWFAEGDVVPEDCWHCDGKGKIDGQKCEILDFPIQPQTKANT